MPWSRIARLVNITTLGLMVGMYSGTGETKAVVGSILIIAIADAFSDALGIHVSEESHKNNCHREIWESTIATFLTKFISACTFIIPVLLFPLKTAIFSSILWGFFLLTLLSYSIAKQKNTPPFPIIAEHLVISICVILITHLVGDGINLLF